MLTRRGFLGRLAGAFAAALALPTLSETLPHTFGSFGAPPVVVDAASRVSVRFIKSWDHELTSVSRMDVLYGYAMRPEFGCRIEDRGSFAAYLEADREIQARVAFPHCANCIRMVGASCRRNGRCLDESYRSAALDFKPDIFGRLWEA